MSGRRALAGKEITADGEKFHWKRNWTLFNSNTPDDQEAGTMWYDCCAAGGVSPVPDHSWLGKCLAQPTAGQRDRKASTHQLSEVWPAVWSHTKWHLSHWSSLDRTMAFSYEGQPEHAFSDHISVPTPSCSHATIHHSAHPILVSRAFLTTYLTTQNRTCPIKEKHAFYKRQLYFKKDQISSPGRYEAGWGADVCGGDTAG